MGAMRKVVLAFDSFKGCLDAAQACQASAQAVRALCPEAEIVSLPLSDGGEGLVDCFVRMGQARPVAVRVHGPLMEEVEAVYAISHDGATAYMEMAAACGLPLVPPERRNPTLTTSYGLGEMMHDAVCRGVQRIVLGIGGSATCDGGQGMLQSFHDDVELLVACDVGNPLYGPQGAAYVFGPQKGATPEQVEWLDQRLRRFAAETERLGLAMPQDAFYPGAGAAGGLGYALLTHLKATLKPGIDIVLDALHFDEAIEGADLIITGEGCSDRQTLMGKVPQGVLQRAQRSKAVACHPQPRVVLLSGQVCDEDDLLAAGFSQAVSINAGDDRPLSTLLRPEVAVENLASTVRKIMDHIIHVSQVAQVVS